LKNYKLSVTHLNNFIDLRDAGPQYFLVHNLLRFPEAMAPAAAYGDAVHKTLQWAYMQFRQSEQLTGMATALTYFDDMLARKHLRESDYIRLEGRGHEALRRYLKQRSKTFKASDIIERGFNNEGVVVNGAHLSGKIDKLRLQDGRAIVTDFKTGKPARTWQGKDEYERLKLHKYRQQLLFYKLLVEYSASYSKRATVQAGALEFIEPDEQGQLIDNLELDFQPQELQHFVHLIGAVWQHIMSLQFPDVSQYPATTKGVMQFEQDLIDGKI
ncbi:MAG TPA: PD-(D/E)XK nuclease family protein, partial [Verrucomicrobiae bacterium]|nr:PD-(D/E)XK nuclease family protein [Verrucomicrobiae bacterium]